MISPSNRSFSCAICWLCLVNGAVQQKWITSVMSVVLSWGIMGLVKFVYEFHWRVSQSGSGSIFQSLVVRFLTCCLLKRRQLMTELQQQQQQQQQQQTTVRLNWALCSVTKRKIKRENYLLFSTRNWVQYCFLCWTRLRRAWRCWLWTTGFVSPSEERNLWHFVFTVMSFIYL